jgi:glycosyltransferase involved in cell wall biosynthesis
MKIVHLNTSDFGGAAMAAIRLHLHLLEQGWESDLLTMNKTRNDIPRHHQVDPFAIPGSSRLTFKWRRLLEKSGIVDDRNNQPDNSNLKNRPPGFEIFTLPYSFFSIADHPLVKAADVVHLHWVGFGMIDEQLFFKVCGKPVVWTMHDMHPITGGCHHADDCNSYWDTCRACPQLANPEKAHQYWLYKKVGVEALHSRPFKIVCPSQWLGHALQSSSLWKNTIPQVVPNGNDERIFCLKDKQNARHLLGLPIDKKIILFNAFDIGNPRKGMRFLIDALEQSSLQDVLLLGIGSKASLHSRHAIQLTGYLQDPEKLALYYAAADLFVLPSMAENLPTTIAESLMCGTPCVAFGVGGVPEMLNASNGVCVEKGNTDALKNAIVSALNASWNHVQISASGIEKYGVGQVGQQYVSLYRSLV